jgi:hypothetical protein
LSRIRDDDVNIGEDTGVDDESTGVDDEQRMDDKKGCYFDEKTKNDDDRPEKNFEKRVLLPTQMM